MAERLVSSLDDVQSKISDMGRLCDELDRTVDSLSSIVQHKVVLNRKIEEYFAPLVAGQAEDSETPDSMDHT